MFIIFKHLFIHAGIITLSALSLSPCAAAQDPTVELTLTPRLCVLGEAEQECQGSITLRWQAQALTNTCLFQDGHTEPLHCWQQTSLGEFTLAPKANRTVRFYLADGGGAVLAEGKFQVLQQHTVHRKRRNPWSFY